MKTVRLKRVTRQIVSGFCQFRLLYTRPSINDTHLPSCDGFPRQKKSAPSIKKHLVNVRRYMLREGWSSIPGGTIVIMIHDEYQAKGHVMPLMTSY